METITFLNGLTFTIPQLSKRNRTLAIKEAAQAIAEYLQSYSAIEIAESEILKGSVQTIINSYLCYKN